MARQQTRSETANQRKCTIRAYELPVTSICGTGRRHKGISHTGAAEYKEGEGHELLAGRWKFICMKILLISHER
jgi:hypothetical protein